MKKVEQPIKLANGKIVKVIMEVQLDAADEKKYYTSPPTYPFMMRRYYAFEVIGYDPYKTIIRIRGLRLNYEVASGNINPLLSGAPKTGKYIGYISFGTARSKTLMGMSNWVRLGDLTTAL